MDQFGNDLKKVLQAGIGAVATGLEKAHDAIEDLSKKGEPLYEQAKAAVTDTVNKAKQAINESAKPQVEDFIGRLQQFSAEELGKIRTALDDMTQQLKETADEQKTEKAEQADEPKDDDAQA